jgi:hypothetical protein
LLNFGDERGQAVELFPDREQAAVSALTTP